MTNRAIALAAALLAGATQAQAQDFACRNAAAEISCADGTCRARTDGFTPMQLSRAGPVLTLCAYSGCWEGRVTFSRSRSGVDFLQARIGRNGDEKDESVLSVMFSRADATAQMRWNGFFNVLECGSVAPD